MGTNSGSAAASSCARAITDSRKHCGVWQRSRVSRGGTCDITPSAAITIVSAVGTAVPTASCVRSAATQSAITRWVTSGRAASCSSTPVVSAGYLMARCASALRTESERVRPPETIALTCSPTSLAASSAYSGGMTSRMSSIPGA